jgi:hypothetical protein
MGLLDDAIREHLDLKRRRGADPTEVERAEREALGPVRRPQSAEQADLEAEPQREDDLAAGHSAEADEEDWSFEEAADRPGEADESSYDQRTAIYEPDFDHEEELQVDPPPAQAEPRPEAAEELAEEPESEPEPPRSPRPHPAGRETVEYDIASEHEHEPDTDAEGSDEDVLEETPEFLQDTPDHDRLWFEQRPPKDFDFGG